MGLFVLLMLVARGAPVFLLYLKILKPAERIPMALLSATGLPLIVVITSIALSEGKMRPENGASLVAAGLLSVLLFPVIGLCRMRGAGLAVAITDTSEEWAEAEGSEGSGQPPAG